MGFLSKIVDGNKKEIKRLGKLADWSGARKT